MDKPNLREAVKVSVHVAIALLALVVAIFAVEFAQWERMQSISDRVSRIEGRQDAFLKFLTQPIEKTGGHILEDRVIDLSGGKPDEE